MLDDMRNTERRDADEPHQHDRAECFADAISAEPLRAEQHQQQHDRDRHDDALQCLAR